MRSEAERPDDQPLTLVLGSAPEQEWVDEFVLDGGGLFRAQLSYGRVLGAQSTYRRAEFKTCLVDYYEPLLHWTESGGLRTDDMYARLRG